MVKRHRTDHEALPDPAQPPYLTCILIVPLLVPLPASGLRLTSPSRLAYISSGMSSSSNEGSPPSCSNLWLVFRAALRRAFVRDAHNPQNVGLEPQRSR